MTSILRQALARGEAYLQHVADLPVQSLPDPREIRAHLERYDFTEPVPSDELVDDVSRMLEAWAVHTVHPRYFGYFNPTPMEEAVAGEILAAVHNPNLAVWSHGPSAVEIEQHVLRWLVGKLGLPADTTGAHFTSGGAEANLTATLAALTSRLPGYGDRGLAALGTRPTLYHSAGAHDSFTKICHMTGMGRDARRVVPVDADLRLDVGALRARMEADRAEGLMPVMAVATAGTTAAGIVDPLEEVAEVCRELGAWFHVDAAWGGATAPSIRSSPPSSGPAASSASSSSWRWRPGAPRATRP
jgi:aromatic-L-amino-acid decarboxylase